jgi:hypothetical protein
VAMTAMSWSLRLLAGSVVPVLPHASNPSCGAVLTLEPGVDLSTSAFLL